MKKLILYPVLVFLTLSIVFGFAELSQNSLPKAVASNDGYPVFPLEFTVVVASDNGVTLRNSAQALKDNRTNVVVARGEEVPCDAWTRSDPVQALGSDVMDSRWYRVKANHYWIPSAWVYNDPDEAPFEPI
jgi:hypothetical protein